VLHGKKEDEGYDRMIVTSFIAPSLLTSQYSFPHISGLSSQMSVLERRFEEKKRKMRKGLK
jgi:hypothetical protein